MYTFMVVCTCSMSYSPCVCVYTVSVCPCVQYSVLCFSGGEENVQTEHILKVSFTQSSIDISDPLIDTLIPD